MVRSVSLFALAIISSVSCDFERQASSEHSLRFTPTHEDVFARERQLRQNIQTYQRLLDSIAQPLFDVRSYIEAGLIPYPEHPRVQAYRATLAAVVPQLRQYPPALVATFLPRESEFLNEAKQFFAQMVDFIVANKDTISGEIKTIMFAGLDLLLVEVAKTLPEDELVPLLLVISAARV